MLIQITVENGDIICKRARVKRPGQVGWTCKYPFVVDFGWDTPLGKQNKAVEKIWGTQPADPDPYETEELPVYADPDKKGSGMKFKYTIAVWDKEHDKILVEDPEIIIDP